MDLKVLKFDGTDVLVPQSFYIYQKNMVHVMKVENERFTALVVRGAGKAENFEGTIDDLKELLNPTSEIRHKMFEDIFLMVQMDIPLYLYGEAGTGKNHIAEQVAKDLGLEFYFVNRLMYEHQFTGYGDAQGRFVETQFYKAFTQGGLFFFDELDASDPSVVIALNAALANGYFDFPVIGKTKKHKDFRVIAAGNTTCLGASDNYSERNVLDGATMDRYALLCVDYDERIELRMANNDEELVDFVHDLRNAVKRSSMKTIISYRSIQRVSKLTTHFDDKKALSYGLLKGMPDDDVAVLYGNLENKNNRFARGLRTLIA